MGAVSVKPYQANVQYSLTKYSACAMAIVKCFQLPSLYNTSDSTCTSTRISLLTVFTLS